ncbi:hypothetical protein CC1G_14755 [Coprinopsis cinerea okayama7|uniref:Uncharacterized protein n=1 Tax=Coprinopsis cinerea (strain Okayama-7 / 130 / ATCC MYA-4618 / FGSC 9003) TaxID=240176 RepID=D6RNL8_COPC7|nr:hypothetical protein CC1G_14755 [Coprinopsis cinerea okayama7\|eukprot:XP_002910777.1 hypothetical protein CC1G_14755 [Coprinopsis cinerea okayama7\
MNLSIRDRVNSFGHSSYSKPAPRERTKDVKAQGPFVTGRNSMTGLILVVAYLPSILEKEQQYARQKRTITMWTNMIEPTAICVTLCAGPDCGRTGKDVNMGQPPCLKLAPPKRTGLDLMTGSRVNRLVRNRRFETSVMKTNWTGPHTRPKIDKEQ